MEEFFENFGYFDDLANFTVNEQCQSDRVRERVLGSGDVLPRSRETALNNRLLVRPLNRERRQKQIYAMRVHEDYRIHFDTIDSRILRINIFSHGVSDGSIAAMTHIRLNNIDRSLDEFVAYIEKFRSTTNFQAVRLAACNSGDGGADSFAQRFANKLGLPVKGYVGPVVCYPAESFVGSKGNYKIRDEDGALLDADWKHAGVFKAEISYNVEGPWNISYKSQWFYPENEII